MNVLVQNMCHEMAQNHRTWNAILYTCIGINFKVISTDVGGLTDIENST